MKSFVIGITLILLLLTGGMPAAHAEETDRPPKQSEGRMKPPPEAIAACKGKSEGTIVQFTTRRAWLINSFLWCLQLPFSEWQALLPFLPVGC